MAEVFIGTSGWNYEHWQAGIFYPENLPSREELRFYSEHFKTVELNASFYHLPKAETFDNWYTQTPDDFLFSVKASRFITHIKRLKDCRNPWNRFINNAKNLKEKLGPVLFQLPPRWKVDRERLRDFVKILDKNFKYVFEFRDSSWFCDEVYKILRRRNIAFCIADSPNLPSAEEITADFIYIRFHGSESLYSSKYTNKELKNWAKKIEKFLKEGLDVYVYFNNDAYGYAVENAREISQILKGIIARER